MTNFRKLGFAAALAVTTGLSTLAMTPAAHANVTIYSGNGPVPSIEIYLRVDAGPVYTSNVYLPAYNGKSGTGGLVQQGGNAWGTSMFGVEGSAQLTPGLKGIYLVESGFNATNGQFNSSTNSIFNRRAYAGLTSAEFGTIKIGKNLFIDNDIYNIDPMIQESVSTSTLVEGRNWGGASNMVEYRSPDMDGLHFGAMISFYDNGPYLNGPKGQALTVSRQDGISLHYDAGPLTLWGIADEIRDNNGHFSNIYSSSREFILGGTLKASVGEIYAGFEQMYAPDAGPNNINSAPTFYAINPANAVYVTQAYQAWIGGVYNFTPNFDIRAAWFHTALNRNGGTANLFGGTAEYSFSKNLLYYLTAADVINNGNADFAVNTGGPIPTPGQSQFTLFTGLSVKF